MSKLLILFFSAIFLSGCFSTAPRKVDVVTSKIETCISPPKAEKIVMKKVDPVAIKDEYGVYWIGITPRQYENSSLNHENFLKYIKQQNAVVNYFKECIKRNMNKYDGSEKKN